MRRDGLDLAAAGGGQLGLPLQRVVLVVLDSDQGRGELIGPVVGGGLFLGRLVVGPDDQRRSGLVDQDAVGLVNDRVSSGCAGRASRDSVCPPRPRNTCSNDLRWRVPELEPLQLVAEEIEAELLAGSVGDVAGISRPARTVGLAGLDAADRHAQQVVDRRHPLSVAAGQVVVDRHDVHALARQGVEERRQGGDQGLAFTGLELGDALVVDGDSAQDLDIEMALADRPLGRLPDQGECLDQQRVERISLAAREAVAREIGA